MAFLGCCGYEISDYEWDEGARDGPIWLAISGVTVGIYYLDDADDPSNFPRAGRYSLCTEDEQLLPASGAGRCRTLTKSGDVFWFHADLKIEECSAQAEWSIYCSDGHKDSNQVYYVIGVEDYSDIETNGWRVKLWRMDVDAIGDPSYTTLATSAFITKTTGADPDLIHVAWKLDDTTPYPTEVWIDGVELIDYAGDDTVTRITTEINLSQDNVETGKGVQDEGFTTHHDNVIITDETGTVMNGRLSSDYVVIGHQPIADVTGLAGWTRNNGTDNKNYAYIDDYNDDLDEADDYLSIAATDITTWNMSAVQDIAEVNGETVEGVSLAAWTQGDAGDPQYWNKCWRLMTEDGDDTDIIGPGWQESTQRVQAPGSKAWTVARFNQLQIGFRNNAEHVSDVRRVQTFVAEACGQNLVRPDATDSRTNDDVPPAYGEVAARRIFVTHG